MFQFSVFPRLFCYKFPLVIWTQFTREMTTFGSSRTYIYTIRVEKRGWWPCNKWVAGLNSREIIGHRVKHISMCSAMRASLMAHDIVTCVACGKNCMCFHESPHWNMKDVKCMSGLRKLSAPISEIGYSGFTYLLNRSTRVILIVIKLNGFPNMLSGRIL